MQRSRPSAKNCNRLLKPLNALRDLNNKFMSVSIRRLNTTDSDFNARLMAVLAFEAAEDEAIDRAAANILAEVKQRGDDAVL